MQVTHVNRFARGDKESMILRQPGEGRGELREGGDVTHEDEVEGRRPK